MTASTAVSVFVSRPNHVSKEFRAGLDGFLTLLSNLGLTPRTLGTTDYARKAPLDEVITLLDECVGAIILGYPQITVERGSIRETVLNEPLVLATEWNHIEAGLAYARELPLLVLHHTGVRRGIFDRGALNSFVYELDLRLPHWPLDPEMSGALRQWKDDCLRPASVRSSR